MEKRTFKCCDCGKEIIVEADCFIKGVYGWIDGMKIRDPTDDYRCRDCLDKAFVEYMEKLGIT